jgi:hypothetical protein
VGAWGSWWSRRGLWQADVFEEPDLDQLISVTLVPKFEPINSCQSVSHSLLLGLALVSGKREPLTNDSPLCVGPKHDMFFSDGRLACCLAALRVQRSK